MAVREQVNHFVSELQHVLGPNLTGIYLHGSLAFGCFNPTQSDIDLLVFTKERLSVDTKRRVAHVLLQCSAQPCPIEVSFLSQDQIAPWRYPTPYDFHYGEEWRDGFREALQAGTWSKWNDEEQVDRDLAAHFTMTSQRGLCLYGQPIGEVFPAVPPEDFRASIVADLRWARERVGQLPVYGILNYCRAWAYWCEGRVYSKDEGAIWALTKLPAELTPVVSAALDAYRHEREGSTFDREGVLALMDYVLQRIHTTESEQEGTRNLTRRCSGRSLRSRR